jgi:tetratricopeptide (TPR) repeat protein
MRYPFDDHPRFEYVRAVGESLYGPMYVVREREGDERLRVLGVIERVVVEDVLALQHELEALTRLDHPLLTGYDAIWSEDGRVVFEREYIEGRPFDAYLESAPGRAAQDDGWEDEDISLTGMETLVALDSLDLARGEGEDSDPHEVGDIFAELSARAPVVTVGLPERLEVLRGVLEDVLWALEFLHRYKRAHGALHPGCLVIDEDGRCHVTEHGLVGLLPGLLEPPPDQASGKRASRKALRALEYRAPEVELGEVPGPWSDVYSLGCVVFEVICGVKYDPADGRTLLELEPSCGTEWAEMVASMLELRPSRRGTARGLLEALGRARTREALLPASVPEAPGAMPGREGTAEALVDAIMEARQAPGLTKFALEAPPGVGKRQAVRHVARALGLRGWLVLRARCEPGEPEVYQAWERVIARLVESLRRANGELLQEVRELRPVAGALFPSLSLRAAEQKVVREDAVAALRALLARVSRERPLLIVLDDACHLEEDALELLIELTSPGEERVEGAVVMTSPPGRLEHIEGVRRRVLPGLTVDDALEMARSIARDEELAELAPALERHPLDNALVLKELIFEARRVQRASGGGNDVGKVCKELARAKGVRAQYARVVSPRLEELDDDAHHLLGVLAVAPGAVPLDVLSGAARRRRRGAPASQQSLTKLCALRLARRERSDRSETPAYRIPNELCRAVVLDDLGEEGERRMFAALSRAYERVGEASATRRFWVYRRQGDVARAVERAGRAMDQASARFAFAMAAEVGRWVLEERPDWDDAARRRHVEKLAGLEGEAGHHVAEAELLGQAVGAREPGERRTRMQVREASAWHRAGEYEQAVSALSSAMRYFGERYEAGSLSGLLARLRAWWSRVSRTRLTEVIEDEPERTSPEFRLRASLYEVALGTWVELNSARALPFARQLEALGMKARSRSWLASAYAHRAYALTEHDVQLARREASRLIEAALELGGEAQALAQLARARLAFHEGRYDVCAQALGRVDARELLPTRLLFEGELAHRLGQAREASRALGALERMARTSHLARTKAARLGAALALGRGDLDEAERCVHALEDAATSPTPNMLELEAVSWRARLNIAQGQPEVVVGTLDVWLESSRAQQLLESRRFEALVRMLHAQACAAELEREVALESSRSHATRERLVGMRRRLKKLEPHLWPLERAELHRAFARFELLSGKRGAALRQVDHSIAIMTTLENPEGRARSAEARARVMLALEQPDGRQLMAQARALQDHLGAFSPLTLEGWGPAERFGG